MSTQDRYPQRKRGAVSYGRKQRRSKPKKHNEQDPKLDEAQRYVLRLAIDYGTVNITMSYQLKLKDKAGSAGTIFQIDFDSNEFESRPWLYWPAGAEQLSWGRDVVNGVRNNRIPLEDVIQMPKVALYLGNRDTPLVESLRKQLKQIAEHQQRKYGLVDLLADHLRLLVEFASDYVIEHDRQARELAATVDMRSMEKEVHLSVPQAWDLNSLTIMSIAARKADIGGQLVSEPQCVAAYMIHHDALCRGELELSVSNECELVVDAGGGTVDLVKYKVQTIDGAKSKLETVGKAKGDHIGSATINEAFVDALGVQLSANPPKGLKPCSSISELLRQMDMTRESFRRQVSNRFERHKTDLDNMQEEEPLTLLTRGTQKHQITLHRVMVEKYLDEGVEKVLDMVAGIIGTDTRGIILGGGFGKCPKLRSRLAAKFDNCNVYPVPQTCGRYPVSDGALLRYEQVDVQTMPQDYTFFTVHDQDYNPEDHGNIDLPELTKAKFGKKKQNQVKDRVTILYKKDQSLEEHKDNYLAPTRWSKHYMPEDTLILEARLFWTDQDTITENAALADLTEGRDYHFWRKFEVGLSRETLARYKYNAPIGKKGEKYFRVAGQIHLDISDAAIKTSFHIVERGKLPAVLGLQDPANSVLVDKFIEEVSWSGRFSDIPEDFDWIDPEGNDPPSAHFEDLDAVDPTDEVEQESETEDHETSGIQEMEQDLDDTLDHSEGSRTSPSTNFKGHDPPEIAGTSSDEEPLAVILKRARSKKATNKQSVSWSNRDRFTIEEALKLLYRDNRAKYDKPFQGSQLIDDLQAYVTAPHLERLENIESTDDQLEFYDWMGKEKLLRRKPDEVEFRLGKEWRKNLDEEERERMSEESRDSNASQLRRSGLSGSQERTSGPRMNERQIDLS